MSDPCPNCVTLLCALRGADAEIKRLRTAAPAAAWWCTFGGCDRWNAGGDVCARCGKGKPEATR